MRLLDRVAHSQTPLLVALDSRPDEPFEMRGARHHAAEVAACPLRFVLADDLTRASAELAFADGARLVGCLDLLRMPGPEVWVEWSDRVHQEVLHETGCIAEPDPLGASRQVGVLLRSATDGCSGVARTFWTEGGDEGAEVIMSPLDTHIDLRGPLPGAADVPSVLAGAYAGSRRAADPALDALLGHVRFKFDPAWAQYYRAASTDAAAERHVVHQSLAAVARDVPLLLAFFLLLSARDATRPVMISRAAINRKRLSRGRALLLDHIEIKASLEDLHRDDAAPAEAAASRLPPRLHHVRGHLVRREDRLFWRVPHLRGSAARGLVRSRTVCLSFARAAARPLRSSRS